MYSNIKGFYYNTVTNKNFIINKKKKKKKNKKKKKKKKKKKLKFNQDKNIFIIYKI